MLIEWFMDIQLFRRIGLFEMMKYNSNNSWKSDLVLFKGRQIECLSL